MKIKCRPTTFGVGHSDPDSPYNQFKSAIKQGFVYNEKYAGKITVSATLYLTKLKSNRSDLDNYAKPIVDALHESRIFDQENQIYRLLLEKVEVEDKDEEGVTIEISEFR
jgi:Holliday junction resolvase RusA-like endonuclease